MARNTKDRCQGAMRKGNEAIVWNNKCQARIASDGQFGNKDCVWKILSGPAKE